MGRQLTSVARLLGNSYAHIQHGIDSVIEWGFEKMKEQDVHKAVEKELNTMTGKAVHAGRGIVGLIGAAGEAYFKTYEELKRKR